MTLRIASFLTAVSVLLGGCAQSHLAQMSEDLGGLGKLNATAVAQPLIDVIYDKPQEAAADPGQPIKAAATSEADAMQPQASGQVAGWGEALVDKVSPLRGSDTSDTP